MKKILLALFSLVITLTINPMVTHAITTGDRKAILEDTIFYESPAGQCFLDSVPSELPDSIPEPYRTAFTQAADKYETDVFLLATVHHLEQSNAYEVPVPEEWPGSHAGAQGPFQFVSNTWPGYAEDADGDGEANIQSIWDAGHAAAHKLSNDGGKRGNELGASSGPLIENTLVYAMASYNAGTGRAKKSATVADLPAETENYIANGVEFYRQLINGDISLINRGASKFGCGGLGVGSDLVFPLRTTKEEIKSGSINPKAVWCYNNRTNCHGSYKAADIHAPEGTPVVAAVSGVVRSAYQSSGSRGYSSVRIEGEDGIWYFYQHMDRDSLAVSKGDVVEAGQQLGSVGDTAAAEYSAPHVHFDMAPEKVEISRECVDVGGCQRAKSLMIDPQPSLVEAFNNLPDRN